MSHPQQSMLTLHGVSKFFGGTKALSDIDVHFQAGKVHALVGENGAGKSTLGKILLGVHQPSQGEISLDGNIIAPKSPAAAKSMGLVGIAQELSLMPNRSVVDNIALGREKTRGWFVDDKATRADALAVMDRYDMHLDPDALVGQLSVAEQQRVEILRALSQDAKLIVFDEPTARLASHQVDQLLRLIKELADKGVAIVYVSHFLEEILEISDTVTILRNGKLIRTNSIAEETRDSLISGVTGREVQNQFPDLHEVNTSGAPILNVSNVSRSGEFQDISFSIQPGEIVGFAGLVGAGRSELAHGIYGSTRLESGKVDFGAETGVQKTISQNLTSGMALVPESRRDQGLFLFRSILENTSLPYLKKFSSFLGLNKGAERREVEKRCFHKRVFI